ncbi:threonine aldolase family protein [Propionimicrobium sp. PCR01-08-3]|uniref:threonine aldolase family protein n=1 Tax=Propionimicrobium sp. PCR01-08-3 TaxID=3052086 RepID=UPI00255CB702|nr:threonine aldolase family protein [Propionimicrobium sp. PCR01-08-3]WIY81672.1 threonine aldolase family protein [Propionimicrobium sp. PCR01-08-3]
MIDLRSDTITKPSAAMREAMAAAPVGDDVYGEDPTINELETRTAALLGHEAGLFCPSGSMANMLGVWTLVPAGGEILCDQRAHIVRAEMGAHAALHGITMRTWASSSGVPGIAQTSDIAELMEVGCGPHLVETAAIEIENTHNFGGGTIHPVETLREIRELCQANGVAMHLDGARLWNAHVATRVPMAEYGSLFDTISVCYSKGMGAPVGSVLVSSAERIDRAREQRKRLGGGMRQAGILAAAALYALDHNIDRLADDHHNAQVFAEQVMARAPEAIDPRHLASNIVVVDTGERLSSEVAAKAAERGVRCSTVGVHKLRAVTHLDVDEAGCREAGRIVGELLAS